MPSLDQLAELVGGKPIGQSDLIISGVSELQNGKQGTISFLENPKYKKYLDSTKASAVIVSDSSLLNRQNGIVVQNPQLAFSKILNVFCPRYTIQKGIHPTAVIDSSVHLGDAVSVGANAVIKANVTIGEGTNVGPNSVIGCNAVIGKECRIHSRITIYHECTIGDRVVIFSGTVIGSDGFGFITEENIHYKIPQIGKVIIGSDVEIGANCTIDRATIGETIIGDMTKLDNLIHIAHNVKIGKNCVISGQVGIAGSSVLEDNVTLAGQVGIVGHLTIAKGSIVAAKSAVYQSIGPDSFVSGIPARHHKDRLRQDVVVNQLPNILNRIRKLEK